MDVKNVVDKFSASINYEKSDYTMNDLIKLLKSAYSNKKIKNSDNSENKEKKKLSAYNIFIQSKMKDYKDADLAPKDKLKKAVEEWKTHKLTLTSSNSEIASP